MLQYIKPAKYLNLLKNPLDLIRTKKVLQVNPTIEATRKEPEHIKIFVYDYNSGEVKEQELQDVVDCYKYLDSTKISWINIDGLRKVEIEDICNHFGIHPLITEDILSFG
ncbi:MAG: magnesium and cobalt transport protein CorA, partial [Ginsengibacter sp.]